MRDHGLDLHRFDLEQEFAKKGCPVCNLLKEYDVKRIDSLLYEFVNDVDVRTEIRETLGFCNYHAWVMGKVAGEISPELLSSVGGSEGVAMIYLDLVETLTNRLKSLVDGSLNIRAKMENSVGELCAICTGRSHLEIAYLKNLLYNIADYAFAEKYAGSDGLCAIHILKTLQLLGYDRNKKELAMVEITRLEKLSIELQQFLRKHDYRFSDEGFGKEADSWVRALRKISGERFAAPIRSRT